MVDIGKWIKKHKLLLGEAGLVTISGLAVTFMVLSIVAMFTSNHLIIAATITSFNAIKNLLWRFVFSELRKKGEKDALHTTKRERASE